MSISAYTQGTGLKVMHQPSGGMASSSNEELDLFQLIQENTSTNKRENFSAILQHMEKPVLASTFTRSSQRYISNDEPPLGKEKMRGEKLIPLQKESVTRDSPHSSQELKDRKKINKSQETVDKSVDMAPKMGKKISPTLDDKDLTTLKLSVPNIEKSQEDLSSIDQAHSVPDAHHFLHAALHGEQSMATSVASSVNQMDNVSQPHVDPHLENQIKEWVATGKVEITQTTPPLDQKISHDFVSSIPLSDLVFDPGEQIIQLPFVQQQQQHSQQPQMRQEMVIQQPLVQQQTNVVQGQYHQFLAQQQANVVQEQYQQSLAQQKQEGTSVQTSQQPLVVQQGAPIQQQQMQQPFVKEQPASSLKNEKGAVETIKVETTKVMGIQQNTVTSSGKTSLTTGSMPTKAASIAEKIQAIQQLKNEMKMGLRKGETHLMIRLTPDALGKVDLKLDISKNGIVSAFFKADNRETMMLLTKHAEELRHIFGESGLRSDTSGMNFSHSDRQDQFDGEPKGMKSAPMANADHDFMSTEKISLINNTARNSIPHSTINIEV